MTSKHAELLNNLNDMQRSLAYAVRRPVLEAAERVIRSQELELVEAVEEIQRLRDCITTTADSLKRCLAPPAN